MLCRKNKVGTQDGKAADEEDELNIAGEYDSDEFPFDPANDAQLKVLNTWTLAPYVDKSHFKMKKVIGVGTHSVIWLVERRPGVRSQLNTSHHYLDKLCGGGLKLLESLRVEQKELPEIVEELGTHKDAKGKTVTLEYAMKVMDKRKLYQMRSVESVK